MRRPVVLLAAALSLVFVTWFYLLPNTLFYQRRRPTRFGRLTNRAMSAYASLGLPPSWQVTLEVRGRRSGRAYSTVLVCADHDGDRYLVSMLGEDSAWVRNVRAAGGDAVIRHGRRRKVRLEEVPASRRAPILKAYLKRAIGARPHFDLSPDADVEEFQRVAARYPAFRMTDAAR
jgi:deazaflavin-dependent oxidoreductase (nitroreductase family)